MINLTRPMLAAKLLEPDVEHTDNNIFAALKQLRYPVYATVKVDGIRGIKLNNLMSRTLKLIPNRAIRYRAMKLPAGFDCELYSSNLRYDEIESIVMSVEHERDSHNDIGFYAIDLFDPIKPYTMRYNDLTRNISNSFADVFWDEPIRCQNADELMNFFLFIEQKNGEGICFRLGNSPYKQGRSTLIEQYLVKLCRYVRTECTIIGFEEQMMNTNSSKRNNVGMIDRSTFKSGMLGKGTLGAFNVRDSNGLEFPVGTGVGLTNKKRLEIWQSQDEWLNKTIVIKSKAHGVKVKPRSPVYVGLRSEIDYE